MRPGGRELKLFISYRREDSIGIAGRIRDRLAHEFGPDNVFFDVDTIPLGADFRVHIEETIAKCDAVLVVIGPRWLTALDDQGQRRLDSVGDFVLLEVEAALRRTIPVVPLLVDGAAIPKTGQLPASIASLTSRNGIPVRHDPDFHTDLDRLIRGLEEPVATAGEPVKKSARTTTTAPRRKVPPVKQSAAKQLEDNNSPAARPTPKKAAAPVVHEAGVRVDLPFVDAVADRQDQSVSWLARQRASVAYDRAKTSETRGHLDAAIVHATKAISVNPKHDSAFWFRGDVREQKGDLDGAIADYTEAFRLNPTFALALFYRGRARERQGDLDGATADYAQCVEQAPDNRDFKEALQRLRRRS